MGYKKTNNEVAIARCINRVIASKGEILSLAPPKKVSKDKSARLPLLPALLGFVGGTNESKTKLLRNMSYLYIVIHN